VDAMERINVYLKSGEKKQVEEDSKKAGFNSMSALMRKLWKDWRKKNK